jgi:hypothetical protein
VFLRDIIDLEATYAGPDAKAMPAPVIGPATVDNNELRCPDPCRRLCGEASRGSPFSIVVEGISDPDRNRRIRPFAKGSVQYGGNTLSFG